MLGWQWSLLGGVLIGCAAALLWLGNGRIAGISGILFGLLQRAREELGWRAAFLVGLIGAGSLTLLWQGADSEWRSGYPRPLLLAAGLLVGFGTRLGSGCTSSHGVCGVARLSWRSIAATLTFMLAGIVTVYLLRHVWGRP